MNANQINAVTKTPYSGKNLAKLQEAASNFESNEWMTFHQGQEKGLAIPKGTKAVSLIRFEKKGRRSEPRWFNVFNIEQFVTKEEAKAAKEKAAKSKPMTDEEVYEMEQEERTPIISDTERQLLSVLEQLETLTKVVNKLLQPFDA